MCMKQERSLLFRTILFCVFDFGYQRNRPTAIHECHNDINCVIIIMPIFSLGYKRVGAGKNKLFCSYYPFTNSSTESYVEFCIQIMDRKCKIAYTIIQIESGKNLHNFIQFMKILKFKVYYKVRTNTMSILVNSKNTKQTNSTVIIISFYKHD